MKSTIIIFLIGYRERLRCRIFCGKVCEGIKAWLASEVGGYYA